MSKTKIYAEVYKNEEDKPSEIQMKPKEMTEEKVNSWLCPINPCYQVVEHFYNMRKKHG